MDTNPLETTLAIHQSEAEKLFAGAVLLNDGYARETCGWLDPGMILDTKIRSFWTRVRDGTPSHEAAMQEQAYYEFAQYMLRVTTALDLPAFANTISLDRYLLDCSSNLSSMARAIGSRDVDTLRTLAQAIAANSPQAGDVIPNAVDMGLRFQVIMDNLEGRSEMTGISTLDAATGGLEKKTMTVIAARPSMGKSSLGIQICKHKAEKDKKRVILFSLEMNCDSIWARMACGELKLSWRDVRASRATGAQKEAIKAKTRELMDRLEDRFMVDETPNVGIDDIWRKVSRYKPDFVVIDHLGLIATKEVNEVKALGEVAWGGKMIAKQFDIPVVFLYQLNRGTENRDNKRPTMADIRGSGMIEENADNIMFIYRPDYYEDAQENGKVVSDTEIIVAKFRDGQRNIVVKLRYHLDAQHFCPPTERLP